MKECKVCKESKPLSDYYKGRGKCKSCYNDYQRQCYLENREARREAQRKYYQENREAQLEYYKKWRQAKRAASKKII